MKSSTGSKMNMPRGAIPSPRSALAKATPFIPSRNIKIDSSYLMCPIQKCYWGNDVYGDCVTAEEAFAKATAKPYIFLNEEYVIEWPGRTIL